jgi:hypothetical protein
MNPGRFISFRNTHTPERVLNETRTKLWTPASGRNRLFRGGFVGLKSWKLRMSRQFAIELDLRSAF